MPMYGAATAHALCCRAEIACFSRATAGSRFEPHEYMRTLLHAVLTLTLLLIVGFFVFGYWTGSSWRQRPSPAPAATGTTGTIDTEKARERGAELGEKAAAATAKAKETLGEAAITAKIKAKMALDDTIKSRGIDVSTNGSTVTLTGTVRSSSERERALALARETDGVAHVADGLKIERQ
jgi:hypothetical protein